MTNSGTGLTADSSQARGNPKARLGEGARCQPRFRGQSFLRTLGYSGGPKTRSKSRWWENRMSWAGGARADEPAVKGKLGATRSAEGGYPSRQEGAVVTGCKPAQRQDAQETPEAQDGQGHSAATSKRPAGELVKKGSMHGQASERPPAIPTQTSAEAGPDNADRVTNKKRRAGEESGRKAATWLKKHENRSLYCARGATQSIRS